MSKYIVAPLGLLKDLRDPQGLMDHTCFSFLGFTGFLLWKSWAKSRLSPGNCIGQGSSVDQALDIGRNLVRGSEQLWGFS